MGIGERTHMDRQPIDEGRAWQQHALYRAAIGKCGAQVHVIGAAAELSSRPRADIGGDVPRSDR